VSVSNWANADQISYRAYDNVHNFRQARIPFAMIPLDQFFMVAFTTEGTTTRSYLDGTLVEADNTADPCAIVPTANPLHMGKATWIPSTDAFVSGTLDRIRIYDRALTGAQLFARWQAR